MNGHDDPDLFGPQTDDEAAREQEDRLNVQVIEPAPATTLTPMTMATSSSTHQMMTP